MNQLYNEILSDIVNESPEALATPNMLNAELGRRLKFCKHCLRPKEDHGKGLKCLFETTTYEPRLVTVKARSSRR